MSTASWLAGSGEREFGGGSVDRGAGERQLVAALRAGDEASFARLVGRYHGPMLRLARRHVASAAVAEEVVQETWLIVFEGVGRFEARSSLKTWLFRILVNRAMTRAARERRCLPFAALARPGDEAGEEGDGAQFVAADAAFAVSRSPYHGLLPEEFVLGRETARRVCQAIAALPLRQRAVITLRDLEGRSAEEVCARLGVSDANQRVLLHRARVGVRRALAANVERSGATAA